MAKHDKTVINETESTTTVFSLVISFTFSLIYTMVMTIEPDNNLLINIFSISLLISLIGNFLVHTESQIAILHNIIPNRQDRELAIVNFFNGERELHKKELEKIKEEKLNQLLKIFPKYSNLEIWVEEHIGKSRAIKKLFAQNVHRDVESSLGLDYYPIFLYWSLHVPLELFNDNTKLEILKQSHFKIDYLSQKNHIGESDDFTPVKKENLKTLFKEYKDNDIIRLFSSAHLSRQYIDIIKTYLKMKEINPLPIFKTMKELKNYIEDYKNQIDFTPFFENNINYIESPVGKFNYIDNYQRLSETANDFNNCARQYRDKCISEEAFFFTWEYKNNYIIFHIDKKGNLLDAKKRFNKDVNKLLKSILRDGISKYLLPMKRKI